MKNTSPSGVLVVDKPEGMTSFVVVDRVRRWLKVKKAGHCGTLDPFATGVLVLCINKATRIADQLSSQDKTYRFRIRLGVETDTQDPTGEVVGTYPGSAVAEEDLREALKRFRGTYIQETPPHAAVKVDGKRLYQWTRQGVEVERPKREVTVYRLELLEYQWPEAELEMECSKGTYVRRLAFDLGRALGCGAHVSDLQRLASGPFTLEQAVSLETLREWKGTDLWKESLISLNDALSHVPAIVVGDERVARRLSDGHLPPEWEARHENDFPDREGPVRLLSGDRDLLALWWRKTGASGSGQSRAGQRRLRVLH